MVEMNSVEQLWHAIQLRGESPAVFWHGRDYSAAELMDDAGDLVRWLGGEGVGSGTVCAYQGDYSPRSCALMLALMKLGAVLVPLTTGASAERKELIELGNVECLIELDVSDRARIEGRFAPPMSALVESFRTTGHSGLIVFTSGSTGQPKAILHDIERVLKKFEKTRPAYRTLQFLLMDHFGGTNTLLSVLSYGGVVVIPEARTVGAVARVIEDAKVELLPVTPTFLTLFVAAGGHRGHDMSSVKLITYGTEVMPESTLNRVAEAFPNAKLQQTYGLSELGVLRSRSRDSGSLWLQVGGPGFEVREVDGVLHVRSEFAMVGYLNAPSPFDNDGWMNTGDAIERDGDWIRILGRSSDLINVGGQKVYPAEVENVLLQAPNVVDAAVYGEPHPLLGSIVVARVVLDEPEEDDTLRRRLRLFCRERLAPYKVPMKFERNLDAHHTDRFKKVRGPR
jgi:long-chain acyl-CoA synthetase